MKIKTSYAAIVAGTALITSMALAIPAFAQTNNAASQGNQGNHTGQWMGRGSGGSSTGMMHGTTPAAFGTVTAINGTTITVSGHAFSKPATGASGTPPATPPASVTYTVDASNATVKKDNATSTVSAIAVGDTIVVQGATNGTAITATSIRDGVMREPGGTKGSGGTSGSGTANMPSPIQGNGQPVVAGTVSAISGSTLTVSTKSNVTYTVDASNAKVVQGNSTASLSSVAVGDSVIIQGATNGTAVTASSVIDQKAPAATTSGTPASHPGFFGSIGNFFSHLFGF